ncbi:MAG: tetratricopeptide repeat protein [Verrucomicrobia bacterium]|nr:tetratricopeptide repeat protein [Verrucomicrobiota bacterium]
MNALRRPLLFAALTLLLVAGAYAPALQNGFVWDDFALIGADPFIRSWRNIPDGWLQRLFFDLTSSEFFRPLQRLSFTLDYALFGLQPAGYHASSILAHLGAMVALAWGAQPLLTLWRRTTALPEGAESWLAWLVALTWGLHPLLTSAVTYIAGRADPLAALFTWAAIGVLARALERPENLRFSGLAVAAMLSLAAALSKESGLLAFALATLVLMLWKPSRRTWLTWLGLAALALAFYGWQRANLQGPSPGLGPLVPLGLRPRLGLEALAEYARLVIAPVDLLMDRCGTGELPSNRAALPGWALASLGTLLLAGAGWLLFRLRRRPLERALWLGSALTYLPISNALSLNASLAEHWLYQPLAWVFLLTGVLLAPRWAQWSPFLRRAAALGLAVWLAALGLRTLLRQTDWRSEEEFFRATIAAGGDSPRMLANLARVRSASDPAGAVALYEEALRRQPSFEAARIALARIRLRQGQVAQAGDLLTGWEPNAINYASYWLTFGEYQRASGKGNGRKELYLAIAKHPTWRTQRALTMSLVEAGQMQPALVQLYQYCEAAPFRSEAWQLLAELAAKADRRELAALALLNARERDVHLQRRQESVPRPDA